MKYKLIDFCIKIKKIYYAIKISKTLGIKYAIGKMVVDTFYDIYLDHAMQKINAKIKKQKEYWVNQAIWGSNENQSKSN